MARLLAIIALVGAWSGGLATAADGESKNAASTATSTAGASATGERGKGSAAVDFAGQVRPILIKRCGKCHGPDVQEAGLRLDLRDRALKGGDSGLAIAPGKPDESLLITKITAEDDAEAMPPDGARLSMAERDVLRRWIGEGAQWPDRLSGEGAQTKHWAFQPIASPSPPDVQNRAWVRDPIDRFILARLEKDGLSPSPEADRRTFVRRLFLDLLGLPPSPAEVQQFVDDPAEDAYERLVDRLLASPHFGERWGRHWLDLARYGDSNGYENDGHRPHAYRYRDWVIKAFNDDLPFDRFTIEQIAGDLLPEGAQEQKIAAGFNRNSLKHGTSENVNEEYRVKAVKDRAETTGAVWLGLTVGCAQCHSHKFDPLTQREYYGFYAFFNCADDADDGDVHTVKAVERTSHVHLRGDYQAPGPEVQPHTPAFLPPLKPRRPEAMVDRLDLARWVVSPENPLTARVSANWTWQHLFGQGLVATPEDFGAKGEPPSHPELLDWLARSFIDGGWRRKRLIRTIVTSAAYRQASHHRTELVETDPRNSLLARQNRFRLEAEIVRDLSRSVAGLVNLEIGGSAVQPPLPEGVANLPVRNERLMEVSQGPDRYRRGVYINVQRTFPHPMMAMFDVADSNQTCPRRDRSNTPLQALALLNDPMFVESAQGLGRRLAASSGDPPARIQWAFELCLARPPNDAEREALAQLWDQSKELYRDAADAARQAAGAKAPHDAPPAETAAWVAVAGALLNLEEFITRE